jgi:aryl-alcohol dehydrogenase-like predicted oxidoreductase
LAESGVNRRRLGRTDLDVSEISLGTVELGLPYGIPEAGRLIQPNETDAAHLLHKALDIGINFIDTARLYGTAEEIIGRALRERRSEYFLASKVPSFAGENLPGHLLRERVVTSVEASLRLLQTEVIDVMMIHSAPVEVIVRGEIIEVLEDVKRKGHVRWLGTSVYGEDAALAAIIDNRYDCLQIAYNLLDRRPEKQILARARAAGVGIIARSVLLKGALTHRYKYLPESLTALRRAVEQAMALAGVSPDGLVELAYRFVLSRQPPDTALAGASSITELEQGVAAAERGPLAANLIGQFGEMTVEPESLLNPGNWPELAPA